ncbi:SRPBCC domain-containing protein [Uliginosibacterium sp. H3]|uniref:SRPBCC domain-containing protein n=1 Tax=Uliginosibacterium silvisoli TaxID=3114758 RepID=A0ABU6K717_9RHOO|nr:SRPBCC domain-containing protein [Uliginosibacterium sp. H3]
MTASINPVQELRITRFFDAPRELVFEVWSKAEHQVHWMGPTDFTVPSCEIDFRVGGRYRTCIVEPTGVEYWIRGEYREIVAPARLVFTFAWEEEGERGMETLVTLQFFDEGDGTRSRTRMEFLQTPFQSLAERDGHDTGWTQCFERLRAYVATQSLGERAREGV